MLNKFTYPVTCVLLGLCLSAPVSAGMIDQSFTSASPQGAQVGITYDGLAQTFTVGVDGIFESAELILGHGNATPLADLTVSLWNTALGIPNAVLASVNLAPGDVTNTGLAAVLIDFSSAMLAVTIGDVLAIGISSADQYGWGAGVDAFATYGGGQRFSDFSGDVGVNWSSLPSWDMSFRTFVDTGATTVPEPATLSLLGLGLVGMSLRRRQKANA